MAKLRDLDNVTLLTLDVLNVEQIKAAVAVVSKETGSKLNVSSGGRRL
jgi:hypothetical protein